MDSELFTPVEQTLISESEMKEIHARQEQLAREALAEETARIQAWERSRVEGPGVTPGVRAVTPLVYHCPKVSLVLSDKAPEDLPHRDEVDPLPGEFVVKDSGRREEFDSGMRRDTEDGKPDFTLIRKGPMFRRWAEHLTKGAVKYGRHNWTKAHSEQEYERFQRSAARHFEQWLDGERDEDHAAAVMFNVNAAEYVRERAF